MTIDVCVFHNQIASLADYRAVEAQFTKYVVTMMIGVQYHHHTVAVIRHALDALNNSVRRRRPQEVADPRVLDPRQAPGQMRSQYRVTVLEPE